MMKRLFKGLWAETCVRAVPHIQKSVSLRLFCHIFKCIIYSQWMISLTVKQQLLLLGWPHGSSFIHSYIPSAIRRQQQLGPALPSRHIGCNSHRSLIHYLLLSICDFLLLQEKACELGISVLMLTKSCVISICNEIIDTINVIIVYWH